MELCEIFRLKEEELRVLQQKQPVVFEKYVISKYLVLLKIVLWKFDFTKNVCHEHLTSLWLLCFGTGPPQDLGEISRHETLFVSFVSKQIEIKDVMFFFSNQSDHICVILQVDM